MRRFQNNYCLKPWYGRRAIVNICSGSRLVTLFSCGYRGRLRDLFSGDWLMPFNEVMLLRIEVGLVNAEKLTIRQRRGSSMFRRNIITRMGEPEPYPALRSGRGRRDITSGPRAPRGPPKIRKTNYEKFHNIGILYPGRVGLASTLTISSYVAFSTTNSSINLDKQETNKQIIEF